MENTNTVIIKCPHCGAQYTLDEIYISKYLTGKSATVVKDALGKILYIDFEEQPDLSEKFNCEYCNKDFNVTLNITATSKKVEDEIDFSNNVVSLF